MTGEVHFVDCGYNTVAMPNLEALKAMEQAPALAGRLAAEGSGVSFARLSARDSRDATWSHC